MISAIWDRTVRGPVTTAHVTWPTQGTSAVIAEVGPVYCGVSTLSRFHQFV